MKSFQVLNAQPILDKLAVMDLPLATSVKLLDPFKKASEIHQTIVAKRQALFDKYGKKDKTTDQIVIPEKNKEKFTEEYTVLMETELDWDFPAIDIEDFGTETNLSIADVSQISWFLNAA